MDPKTQREQLVREAKVSLILDAARKVFSENGFFEARLEDIATIAGFSKAALYSYYDDKEEIFLSLALRDLENLYFETAKGIHPDFTFLINIEQTLKTAFTFFGDNFSLLLSVSNFQAICHCHQEKLSEKHQNLFARLSELFRNLLNQYVSLIQHARIKGEIVSTVDDTQLAHYVGALIRGVLFQWQISGRMGDVTSEVQQLVSFLAVGLRCPLFSENMSKVNDHSLECQ